MIILEFMSKPVVYLQEIEKVGDVVETLQVSGIIFSINNLTLCSLQHIISIL